MTAATLEMKQVNPTVARVLSGRVARTDSVETHARRVVEQTVATLAFSQNAQMKALTMLVDGDRERSTLDEIARALTTAWIDELSTETMCDHYAARFSTVTGGGFASGWREERDRIFRDMTRRGANRLLVHSHQAAHSDFQAAKHETLAELRRVFGEELGWLLMNCGIRSRLVNWVHEAGFRFDWQQHFHVDRFTEQVFGEMMVRAPWNKNVRLNRPQLLREDAGAILLAHVAPCTLDAIEDWIRPGIRQPRGLKKRELKRMYEQMIIELRDRSGGEIRHDELGRMVDPAA